jgi:septal ring factor EnvC (AmiA/AmiB activator)
MEITDVTTITGRGGLLRRLARPLRERSGPPSLRAQLVLIVAAILFGAVLAGLLFVGVWRHTAAESDAARTAQIQTSRRLHTTKARLDAIRAQLAATRATAARERTQLASLRRDLAAAQRANAHAAQSLASPLSAIAANGGALQHQLAKLSSELSSIGGYLASAGAGVDPAFVAAQVRYLTSSAGAADSAVAVLARQASLAQAAAHQLGRKP